MRQAGKAEQHSSRDTHKWWWLIVWPSGRRQDIVAFIHREPLVVGSNGWHCTELLMEPTSDWLCYTAGNPNRRADTPTGTGDVDVPPERIPVCRQRDG